MTNSYAQYISTRHQVGAIRGRGLRLSPEAIGAATHIDADADIAPVVPMSRRPPVRDGATRAGATVPLDDSNRVNLKKPLDLLGWKPGTELVARTGSVTAVVSVGRPTRHEPWLSTLTVDGAGRLKLSPDVKAALRLRAGDQVLACAVADTNEMHLGAAADLLQQFTGAVATQPAVAEPTASAPVAAPKTRVTRRRVAM